MVRRALLALVAAALLAVAPAHAHAQTPLDVRKDVQYGSPVARPLLLDAYLPPSGGNERRPAVILIHGGTFRTGDKASFEPEARRLAAQGWAAFSVNYRLDEPAAFPSELDDVRAAVHWVRDNAAAYEVDPSRIGVLGESAGGTLAALLATTEPAVTAAVSWSGPMDLVKLTEERGDSWAVPLMGCSLSACRDRFAEASPITHVRRSGAPLQLQISQEEQLPLDQATSMVQRMDATGMDGALRVMRGTRHALDYRDEAIGPSVEFLRQRLDRAPKEPATSWAFLLTIVVLILGSGLLTWHRVRRLRAFNGTKAEPYDVARHRSMQRRTLPTCNDA